MAVGRSWCARGEGGEEVGGVVLREDRQWLAGLWSHERIIHMLVLERESGLE